MRTRTAIMCSGLVVLGGCTLFSPQKPVHTSRGALKFAASLLSDDLKSVGPGDWCRVKMQEVNYGFGRKQTEYIGKIEEIASGSITLDEAATRVWNLGSSIDKIPVLNRLTETEMKELPTPMEISLENVASIEWIAPENVELAKWGRIGISKGTKR